MKKPFIISVEQINKSLDAYNNSGAGQRKIQSALAACERNKEWIEKFQRERV